jgi:hypothetical protein
MALGKPIKILLLTGIMSAGVMLLFGNFSHHREFEPLADSLSIPGWTSPEHTQKEALKQAIQHLEAAGYLVPLSSAITLPFEAIGDYLLIQAQVSEKAEPQTFIFDSGIKSLILDHNLADQIALEQTLSLANNAVYGLLPQINLGEATFQQIGTFAVDFSAPGQPLQCLSKNGVVGANLLRHGVWQINYRDQTVTIANDIEQLKQIAPDGDHHLAQNPIPLLLEFRQDNRPVIQLQVNETSRINALIDTGWGGSIQLRNGDFPETINDSPLLTLEGRVETLAGVQTFNQSLVELPSLTIGDLTLTDFPVLVGANDSTQLPLAIIGNDFLQHFIVTFDWVNGNLYLDQQSPASDLYPQFEGYGFQAMVQGQQLIITGLQYPSPIEQAGLHIGDQILTINGDNYGYPGEELFCEFIYRPVGERYSGPLTITIKRNGEILTFNVSPEAMVGGRRVDSP